MCVYCFTVFFFRRRLETGLSILFVVFKELGFYLLILFFLFSKLFSDLALLMAFSFLNHSYSKF